MGIAVHFAERLFGEKVGAFFQPLNSTADRIFMSVSVIAALLYEEYFIKKLKKSRKYKEPVMTIYFLLIASF